MDNYLMHYGVMGMKWGVRKANYYDKNEKRVIKSAYEKKMKELGYSDAAIKAVNDKINQEFKKKKKANKKESRRQMYLSKINPEIPKEEFANEKYKKAKFKKYQKKKSEWDARNIKRYKENLALYIAGWVAPGPIVTDIMGLAAAVGNDIRYRKENGKLKRRLDSILNTEINSLSNKISEVDVQKMLKHGEEDQMTDIGLSDRIEHSEMAGESFNDVKDLGYDVLKHYGRDGMKWGVRNGPPYPLDKKGLARFRENLKERRAAKKRRKILSDPKLLQKHIDEFTPEELAEEATKQQIYNDIGYQKKWNKRNIKLSKKQKQMANNAVSLMSNMDKFDDEEYAKAYDRLQKREDLKDTIVRGLNRPAGVIAVGANILGSVRAGAGSVMSMHDMYSKAFGGATYDESHAAWLNNNKEPISGKLWSRIIGESAAAQRGSKYEYLDEKERAAKDKQNRNDKLWTAKYGIDKKNDIAYSTKKYETDEKQKTERAKATQNYQNSQKQMALDYQKSLNQQQMDYIKEREKWDFYTAMNQIPFQNVTNYTENANNQTTNKNNRTYNWS